MQRLLNEKEAALIDARLHDNTLLEVCRRIWPERQEEITSVMVKAEDLFCESVWLMDKFIEADADTDATSLARGLWSTVFNDIGYWANGVSKNDRYLIASTIFRLVAAAFSLHWHSHYCDTLRDALLTMVDERRPSPETLHDQQQQEQQQEELFGAIVTCSTVLKDWVIDYIDNPETWLTEEIDLALNPHLSNKSNKPESRKADKNPSQKVKKDYTRYSFRLNVKSKQLEELYLMLSQRDDKGKRFIDGNLQEFNDATKCLSLDKEYLKQLKPVDIDKMLFNHVFSGQESDVRIVWRGDAIELWYLINTLYNYKVKGKRLLDKSGTGPGIWQIVRYRFLNGKTRKVNDERIGKEIETSNPIEYEEDAFSHYSKNNSLSDSSTIDAIIRKIAPPRDKTDEEEIEEETKQYKFGIKSPSSVKQFGEGFRDTNHKGKNQ